jgi:secreted PhoX family phosphatase
MMRRTTYAPLIAASLAIAGYATLAGVGTALTPAFAANSACDGVKVEVTNARRAEYAPLVASAMGQKVRPDQVKFSTIMESGNWSAAYVSTPVSDDGVMFFQTVAGKKRFREVWGGWADPSERPELVAWARKLGAPADLARCFAETVTGDE